MTTESRMREALEKWLREQGPAFDTQLNSVKELTIGLAMPYFKAGWDAALSPPAHRTEYEWKVGRRTFRVLYPHGEGGWWVEVEPYAAEISEDEMLSAMSAAIAALAGLSKPKEES